MEPEVVASTTDAFDSAVTSASTYVEPTVATTDSDAETQVEHAAAARDANGRFITAKPEEAEKPAEAVEAKPAGKPRNDPQARIDQVIKEREDAKREAAKYKAELDAARAPREAPKPAPVDAAPDANDAAKYPGGEYDPKFLKDQARYEAKQEFREQHAAQQVEADDARKDREFDTRASSFVKRLSESGAKDQIDNRLLSGKPLSLLTSKERAGIAKMSPQEQREVAFLCFLADQWDGKEHDIELVKYLSVPDNFQRLATLQPHEVVWELASVHRGFGAAPPKDVSGSAPKPSASQAKPPFKPLGTTAHAVADDDGSDDESVDKHIQRENARDRKSGRL